MRHGPLDRCGSNSARRAAPRRRAMPRAGDRSHTNDRSAPARLRGPRRAPREALLPCGGSRARSDAGVGIVDREADLQHDLVVLDLAAFEVAAGLKHLEPAQTSEGASGTAHRGLNRVLDAGLRRAADLDDPVDVVLHRFLLSNERCCATKAKRARYSISSCCADSV